MRQYLIKCDGIEPFLTDYYTYENNYNAELNMVVYDLFKCAYTTDGITWNEILIDRL